MLIIYFRIIFDVLLTGQFLDTLYQRRLDAIIRGFGIIIDQVRGGNFYNVIASVVLHLSSDVVKAFTKCQLHVGSYNRFAEAHDK